MNRLDSAHSTAQDAGPMEPHELTVGTSSVDLWRLAPPVESARQVVVEHGGVVVDADSGETPSPTGTTGGFAVVLRFSCPSARWPALRDALLSLLTEYPH